VPAMSDVDTSTGRRNAPVSPDRKCTVRSETLHIRINIAEAARIKLAARRFHLDVSEWVRRTLADASAMPPTQRLGRTTLIDLRSQINALDSFMAKWPAAPHVAYVRDRLSQMRVSINELLARIMRR
jgi:hypothetical protein